MISKGLDFPDVTLVGIIMADISLNVPDYRAAERCFQLITQVAGRAGRGEKAGEVIVQTYNPEHYAIQAASKQDYLSFVTEELEHRKTLYYPPYYRLARIVFTCSDLSLLKLEMRKIEQIKLEMVSKFRLAEILVIGPSEAPLNKINNQHRYHMIVKARNHELMRRALEMFEASYKTESYITHYIDVDPASLM
jgi:primosomal protein N' (replication factor Y)